MEITHEYVNGHYNIYVDGKFYCSCDVSELYETEEEILEGEDEKTDYG